MPQRKRRDVNELIKAVRSHGADGIFDEIVRQRKEAEAAEINAKGLRRQIEYLTESVGLEALHGLLRHLLEHQQDVLAAVAEASQNGSVASVRDAVYSEKQSEADDLTSRDLPAQITYLIEKLGSVARLRRRLHCRSHTNGG
jgi:hypothetical protein